MTINQEFHTLVYKATGFHRMGVGAFARLPNEALN